MQRFLFPQTFCNRVGHAKPLYSTVQSFLFSRQPEIPPVTLMLNFCLILLSIHVPYVLGHGFVASVTTEGKTYPGWNPVVDPFNPTPPRVIRKVQSDGPITDPGTPNISCNVDGNEGTLALAEAQDGSSVEFQWTKWLTDHLGPISTYMTSCNGNCSKFLANDAGKSWFKVDAAGYDNSTWATQKLIDQNSSWTSKIPRGLKPGQYLMRNELVALHSIHKPQFYPSCLQITVSGSGTHTPSSDDLISITELWTGINYPDIDIWNTTSPITFVFPGPPAVNFDGSGGEPPSSSLSLNLTSTTKPSSTGSIVPSSTPRSSSSSLNRTSTTKPSPTGSIVPSSTLSHR